MRLKRMVIEKGVSNARNGKLINGPNGELVCSNTR
jgi:hypothetical protein